MKGNGKGVPVAIVVRPEAKPAYAPPITFTARELEVAFPIAYATPLPQKGSRDYLSFLAKLQAALDSLRR